MSDTRLTISTMMHVERETAETIKFDYVIDVFCSCKSSEWWR